MSDQHLLSGEQLAAFVADGFLRFDALVPEDLCARAEREMQNGCFDDIYGDNGRDWAAMWPDSAVGEAFRLPAVQGIVQSLLGAAPRFDHQAVHRVPGGTRKQATLHQDNDFDPRPRSFDIQLSFFPHTVTPEMGGTLFVPGSHLRRVRESVIGRYHHVRGSQATVCPAGTVVVWHHNLWHGARSNRSERERLMFKVRLAPTRSQRGLFAQTDPAREDIARELARRHPWQGVEYRAELRNRIMLWRWLSGDDDFDVMGYGFRIGNEPALANERVMAS